MSNSSTSSVEIKLAALRTAYLNDLPKKFSEIERLWLVMAGPNWQGIHAQELHRHLHSMAGSGTTFGAPEISRVARELEQKFKIIINENRNASAAERKEMSNDFRDLDRAVAEAIKNLPVKEVAKKKPVRKDKSNEKLIYLLSDDERAASRYQSELAIADFTIESFSDSNDFFKQINFNLPRAVIVDVASPENSFRELQHIHKALSDGQQPPAVLYASVQNDIETRLSALKIGAERFFTKPVNFTKLIETLNGLILQAPREPYRVLIVDDVETRAEFYATTLEKTGFDTRVINNPLYALTELEKFRPDLVLMDVYMHECSGLKLAAVMRQDDKFAEMPIVFLSTETDLDKQMAAMNLGGDDFLTKPVEPEHLISVVLARAKRSRWLSRMRNELQSALYDNERQKIEIQRKEERLKRSQRYSNIGTWDWHIKTGDIYWSERVMPLYGHEAGEVVIRYEDFIDKIHTDDRQTLTNAINECLNNNREYEIEHRVVWPDKSIHWLLERGDVQRDANGEAVHMLGVVQDVTNRKQLEHTLGEQKSLLSMLQNGLSQYVSSRAIHYTSRYMLDGLLKLTQSEYGLIGEVLQDETGKPYFETHVMSDLSRNKELSKYFDPPNGSGMQVTNLDNVLGKVIESGKPLVLNADEMQGFNTSFPNGHPVPETFAGIPICFGDKVVGLYALANRKYGYDDRILEFLKPFNATYSVIINAYRLVEQEQHIKSDLQEAKDAADRANQAKSDFLNHMSHEFRTPMNAILGFSQLIGVDDDDPVSDKHRDYVNEIIKAGRHLLELIDEVLDLARIEAGKLRLSIDAVQLRDVIDECLRLIEPLAANRQLTLKFSDMQSFDVWVLADRMRLKQVLLNLLSNAIKYNRESGTLGLTCEIEEEFIRLSVTDTGEGIPEDKLDKLFEAFNRLGAENSTVEGTGIGLMISRHMIELMGGHLEIKSTVGEGSCFSFTLPLAQI